MPMYRELQLITAKEETTYGTDAAPTAGANAILAQNVKLTPMAASEVTRGHARPWLGARPSLLVGRHARISFEVEAKGAGAKGSAPGYGVLLRSCKMAEVTVAATSVTYNPTSTDMKSRSLYFYLDGTLFKMTGCRGDWKYKLSADGIAVIEFTFTGLFVQPSTAAVPAPTWGTQLSEIPQAASTETVTTFSIGAYAAAVLRSLTFSAGNEVKYRSLIRGSQVIIAQSDEALEFQIEAVGLASFNPFSLAAGHGTQTVTLVHGVGDGKIVTLTVPDFQLLNPGDLQVQDGIVEYNLRGKCLPGSSGNNQFSLAFT